MGEEALDLRHADAKRYALAKRLTWFIRIARPLKRRPAPTEPWRKEADFSENSDK